MLHTLVTFVAEPKSGSQEIGTQSNLNLMEGMMFRGEGENGLTFGKLWYFYFHPLILRNCGEIWILSPFCLAFFISARSALLLLSKKYLINKYNFLNALPPS